MRVSPPQPIPAILGLAASDRGIVIHIYHPWLAAHQVLTSTPDGDSSEQYGFGRADEATAEFAWQCAQIGARPDWWAMTTQEHTR